MTCLPWVNQSVTVHWNPVGVTVFGSSFGSLETLHSDLKALLIGETRRAIGGSRRSPPDRCLEG